MLHIFTFNLIPNGTHDRKWVNKTQTKSQKIEIHFKLHIIIPV